MKFIRPSAITTANLISSSVAETDYSAWSAATTYAIGNRVISTTTHRIYESAQDANLNHDPVTDTSNPAWWIDIGPTNRWAMFDRAVGTITTGATPLAVTIAPGIVNSLALLDLYASGVTVTITDGLAGPTVFSQSYTLGDSAELFDWYMYFFDPIIQKDSLIVENLPPYTAAHITISIASAGANAECGTLSLGTMVEVGQTRYGAEIGILDYSKKETDIFGITSVLERAYAKRIEARVLIDNDRLDYIARQLSAVRATPCVWAADNSGGYSSMVAYGFYKDWRINISYPNQSDASLTIEGLT